MDKLKCKVVMLSTHEKAIIGDLVILQGAIEDIGILKSISEENKFTARIPSGTQTHWKVEKQDLYFTKTIPVSNLDTFNPTKPLLFISSNGLIETITTSNIRVKTPGQYYEIIATTNTSLKLPLIGQAFVEKYMRVQGKIEYVLLECTVFESSQKSTQTGSLALIDEISIELKLRHDNTVIVSPVKDSWTREEVFELLDKYDREFKLDSHAYTKPVDYTVLDWFNRNI